jgi:hypothetical protein
VDQQNGNWLLWLVAGVLIGAISIIISSSQRDKDRDRRRGRDRADEDIESNRRTRKKAKDSDRSAALVAPEQAKQLIIPPPDEARIEAIAPKNDATRRFR